MRGGSTDDGLLARPIFILGAPRSGTAILAQVLRAHPALAFVREPRLVWRFGNDDKSDLLTAGDARPEVSDHIRAFFAQAVAEQGRQRLLEKTPSNALRPDFLDAVFPDCLFVHVMRDGPDCIAAIHRRWLEPPRDLRVPRQRDRLRRHVREAGLWRSRHYVKELVQKLTARSWSRIVGARLWGPRLPGMETMVRELDLVDVCALQWRLCVERAAQYGRQLPTDRYMECRLETLDEGSIRQILAFCGLADEDGAVVAEFKAAYQSEAVLPRATSLTAWQRDRVETWVEPVRAWLGQ